MGYIFRNLVSFDQLGNTIAGGNPDATISARVGYYATKRNKFWLFLQSIVNFTFFPVDGPGHCFEAYKKDKDEKFRRGSDVGLWCLALFVIAFCLVISITNSE